MYILLKLCTYFVDFIKMNDIELLDTLLLKYTYFRGIRASREIKYTFDLIVSLPWPFSWGMRKSIKYNIKSAVLKFHKSENKNQSSESKKA